MRSTLLIRRLVLTVLLALIISVVIPVAQAATEVEMKTVIEQLFATRYKVLQTLNLSQEFREFFVPEVLDQPSVLSEVDRLAALVTYRKAQNNDLALTDQVSFELKYVAAQLAGSRAEVMLEETYEYYFASAPTVPNRGTLVHALTLESRSGEWRVVRNDYADPDGFYKVLDETFAQPGMDKAGAIAIIVGRAQAADQAWNERFATLLEPFPEILVFMQGQSQAWLDGRVQRLDPENMVTPVFFGEELYLPLRIVVERLGGEVIWRAETGMIEATLQAQTLAFVNLASEVTLNGEPRVLSQAILSVANRAMLPASVVSEFLQRTLYLDSAGLAILAREPLSAAEQAELHNKLASLYQARFSAGDFPKIDGSTATYPLTVAMGKELLALDETAVRGFLTHNTTHNAYVNLLEKKADLILVTPPSDAELQMAQIAGIELEIIPVCKEGFVFLVNEMNPVHSLTTEQIERIYAGEITNWSEVGGEDLPLVAYQREPNSGSQTLMETVVMRDKPLMNPPKEQLIMGMGPLIDRVADYSNARGALGYSMYYYATTMYGNRAVRLLAVNGIEPKAATFQDNTFPYAVSYFAVLRKDEPENSPARRLLAWLLSDVGQQVAEGAGFVPLSGVGSA